VSATRAPKVDAPGRVPISRAAWRVGAITAAGTFLFVLDSGLLSIAFPSLQAAFPDSDRSTLSWAFTGFSVVMAAVMAFAGAVADRIGRARCYLLGLVGYTAGAFATAAAPNPTVLIGARLIQGASAGFFVTAGLALALVAFPPERRATALGLWGIVGSAAAVVAPTLGAAALDTWSWRWAFGALAVVSAGAAIAATRLERDVPMHQGTGPPDPVGVVLGAGGIALVMLGIARSSVWGWADARTIGSMAIGAALLAIVVVRSRHHPRPLLPPVLARHHEYRTLTLACVIQQVGFFAYFFSSPIILTGVWGWSVLQAGWAMALSMVVSALAIPPAAKWVESRGYTRLVLIGAAIVAAAAVWWLLTFDVTPDVTGALLPGLVLMGVGSSIVGNFTSGAALAHVPTALMGSGNSLHQMARRIGGGIGVALTVALLGETGDPVKLLDGARRVWILLVVVHAAMSVFVWLGRSSSAGSLGVETL
jgi:EmrB/QacA subfamily drug resistance transporter